MNSYVGVEIKPLVPSLLHKSNTHYMGVVRKLESLRRVVMANFVSIAIIDLEYYILLIEY